MSNGTQTPQGSGLSDLKVLTQEPEKKTDLPQKGGDKPPSKDGHTPQERPVKPEKAKESKVHRLSQGKQPYTPKNRERKKPVLLTVEQYLRKANQDKTISDLVRSLHKTKVMKFEDWEREITTLLKKQTN